MEVDVYDPWASVNEVKQKLNLDLKSKLKGNHYDAIVHTVCHLQFKKIKLSAYKKPKSVVYDVKGTLNIEDINGRL